MIKKEKLYKINNDSNRKGKWKMKKKQREIWMKSKK